MSINWQIGVTTSSAGRRILQIYILQCLILNWNLRKQLPWLANDPCLCMWFLNKPSFIPYSICLWKIDYDLKGTLIRIYLRILLEKYFKDYNCPGVWNSNCMQIHFMLFSLALSAATAGCAYLVKECIIKTDRLLNEKMGMKTRDLNTKYTFLMVEILCLEQSCIF